MMNPKKISLLAGSIRTRIGPLSHAINYNGRHVSDRVLIAELENLLRISRAAFPENEEYFQNVQRELTTGNVRLARLIEVLDQIDDLALHRASLQTVP